MEKTNLTYHIYKLHKGVLIVQNLKNEKYLMNMKRK